MPRAVSAPTHRFAQMENIEETESAKRMLMAKKAAPAPARSQHSMQIPGNYNANFHQHRREVFPTVVCPALLLSPTRTQPHARARSQQS